MLCQHRRCCANIKTASFQCVVFVGNVPAVIKERKGVLIKCVTYTEQIVIVLLAVILHKQNLSQVEL